MLSGKLISATVGSMSRQETTVAGHNHMEKRRSRCPERKEDPVARKEKKIPLPGKKRRSRCPERKEDPVARKEKKIPLPGKKRRSRCPERKEDPVARKEKKIPLPGKKRGLSHARTRKSKSHTWTRK